MWNVYDDIMTQPRRRIPDLIPHPNPFLIKIRVSKNEKIPIREEGHAHVSTVSASG